jgi:tRNA threonylcarbamoyladenosine biosynthesis protein TsaE
VPSSGVHRPVLRPFDRVGAMVCHRFGVSVVRFSRRSASLFETVTLARELVRHVRRGDVVLLIGDLGAGKTAFAKGFGAALGAAEEITSPTFTIMRDYPVTLPDGPARFLHLDAYRLEGPGAVDDIGLFELLDEGGFALIEWGDLVAAAFGRDPLVIEFVCLSDDEREISVSAAGDGPWAGRLHDWLGTPSSAGVSCGVGTDGRSS